MIINLKSQTNLSGLYVVYEGSTNLEKKGNYGISHLMEHLMCKTFFHMIQDFDRDFTFHIGEKIENDDINILLKTVISYIPIKKNNKEINNKIYNKLKLIENSINLNEKINFNDNTFRDLFLGLMHLLHKLPETSALTYLSIITEELSYVINNKLGCPPNKLEIILTNLVPFIDYPFNVSIDWVISLELKYLILKLIKNSIDIKTDLMEKLWEIYIKSEIIQEDYLGCLISQWIAKIKV